MPGPLARAALAAVLLAGCASSAASPPIGASTIASTPGVPTTVARPEGPGPFPAVVILHDCSGLGPYSSGAPSRWSRELVGRGYVVVIPDSFTTRGFPNGVCTDSSPARAAVAASRRVADAYEALAYARSLPYVDGRHVGLMGGSHGGSTTLASMAAPEAALDPLAREKRAGFAAAVALYPGCAATFGSWRARSGVYRAVAPVLILVGERDDWTPAEPCQRLVESTRPGDPPVAIRVYPGAHHSFDSDRPVRYVAGRVNMNAPGGRGATTGGDPEAWADSIRRVAEFFDRHLS